MNELPLGAFESIVVRLGRHGEAEGPFRLPHRIAFSTGRGNYKRSCNLHSVHKQQPAAYATGCCLCAEGAIERTSYVVACSAGGLEGCKPAKNSQCSAGASGEA